MEKKIFLISVCFFTIFTACDSSRAEELESSLPHQILDDRNVYSSYNIRDKRDTAESNTSSSNVKSISDSNVSSKLSAMHDLNEMQQLLGVNGTGQKKDLSSTTEKPILAANISTTKVDSSDPHLFSEHHEVYSEATPNGEIPEEDIFDKADESDREVEKELTYNNFTVQYDHHVYYNSSLVVDQSIVDKRWNEITKNLTVSQLLSKSHRRAMTIQLTFDFPFYGHPVRNVTVATGGFLYTGDHVHSWLAATQYIAPLMANFDSSLSNDSYVKYSDNGTAFTVLWENIHLQDRTVDGAFTFSATLHKSGNITFVYYKIPISIMQIMDDKHPVKIGLSDAYIIDKTIFFARRKTIYEYHRVTFPPEKIKNNTLIKLTALETCNAYKDCQSCTSNHWKIQCRWCPTIERCSSGTDRRRQEWIHKGCDSIKVEKLEECPAIGQKGNNFSVTHDQFDEEETPVENTNRSGIENSPITAKVEPNPGNWNTILPVLLAMGFLTTVAFWALYAYRNPHTSSGQFLIRHRPSTWSWRRGEARYTAATIHMSNPNPTV